jgi:hypothetical protein
VFEESVEGSHPEGTVPTHKKRRDTLIHVGVFSDHPDIVRRDPVLGGSSGDRTMRECRDTSPICPDPEVPLPILKKRSNSIREKPGVGFPVKHNKADSVKPKETVVGTDPEVAISGLEERLDARSRKTVVVVPRI